MSAPISIDYLNNPAIATYGRRMDAGGSNSFSTTVGAEIVFVAHATDAAVRLYAGDRFDVSIDGGAFFHPPEQDSGSGVVTVPLFAGLPAGEHLVVLKSTGNTYWPNTDFIQLTGGTSAVRAPGAADGGGYGVYERLGDTTFAASGSVGSLNATTDNNYNAPTAWLAKPNGSVRRKVKATGNASVRAWVYQDGSKWAVYLNRVKQAVVTVPNLGIWGWVTLLANANLSGEPELQLSLAYGVTGSQGYIDALMTAGAGAALSASAVAARPIIVGWGDSKTHGTAGTANDASVDVLQLLADSLGLEVCNLGVDGDTEGNAMNSRSGQLTGILPAPAIVLDRFGTNDGSPTADVSNMIAAVKAAYGSATKIIVCGVDNRNGVDAATQAAKSANRQAAVTTANDPHVTYVDMTDVIVATGPTGNGYDTADGVHENAQGYQKDYARLRPFVAAALGLNNAAPTIIAPANRSVTAGQSTGALAVTVGDAEDNPAALTLSASSSNPSLIPNSAITLGGSGASRTVAIAAPNLPPQTTTITLTAMDTAGSQTSASFVVTVNPNSASNALTPMTFTSHNAIITEDHTSQQVLAANGSRAFYFLQNCSGHAMYVGVGQAATKEGGSIHLSPGEHLDWSDLPTTQAINVLSPVAGGQFTLLEA